MTETPAPAAPVSPWAEPAKAPPPARPSRLTQFVWGLVSTLLLAAWVSWQMGWLWGLSAVFGVFVHEFGHVMVINWAGSGPSRIRIIPFFGGAATMRRAPDSDFKGVLIALAGPAFGLLAAAPFYLAATLTGERTWMTGAFLVGALNLVNLAPAAPLDGAKAIGPALARIHPWLERGVLIAIAAAALAWALLRGSWLFAAVIGFGAARAFAASRIRPPARPLTAREWAMSVALYAVVVALCAAVTVDAGRSAHVASQFFSIGGGFR